MHFSIILKKYVSDAKSEFMAILLLKGFTFLRIQKLKFQKMCILHNGSNISNTSFELFDLKNVQYQLE
jgi:hypothetical protein